MAVAVAAAALAVADEQVASMGRRAGRGTELTSSGARSYVMFQVMSSSSSLSVQSRSAAVGS